MRNRRYEFEIVRDILLLLKSLKNSGERSTRLTQKSGVSCDGMKYYKQLLIVNELIEFKNKRNYITEKGIKYLKKIDYHLNKLKLIEVDLPRDYRIAVKEKKDE